MRLHLRMTRLEASLSGGLREAHDFGCLFIYRLWVILDVNLVILSDIVCLLISHYGVAVRPYKRVSVN